MKVVVVDAAAAVRSRVVALLWEAGLTVVGEAATAAHARRCIREHAPHPVVLDVDLPDREGLALVEELVPSHFVVVVTNALAYRRRCLALGAHAFLDKSTEFASVSDALLRDMV